jgi:uncharacterized membrane protein YadS
MASLGFAGFGAIVGLLAGTILLGLLLSRRDWQFSMLTGGAVAICGASAALAISDCLPQGKALERETLFTLVAVTALSTLAMILLILPHRSGPPLCLGKRRIHDGQQATKSGRDCHEVTAG